MEHNAIVLAGSMHMLPAIMLFSAISAYSSILCACAGVLLIDPNYI